MESFLRSPWMVTAAASAVLFVGVGYTNTFGIFARHYQEQVMPDAPAEQIILIGSVASSLYFILGALTGRFADLIGYKVSLFLGSALMISSLFASSVSTGFWQLFLTQGVMFGLGLAFVYAPATAISRQHFDSSTHGLANGIVVSGGALGGCVLPYCVQRMLESYDLPGTFRILGYLAFGILVPSAALIRPRAQLQNNCSKAIFDLTLLKNEKFLRMIAGCSIAMTGFLPRYFLVPTSAEIQGVSQAYSSWLLGLMNGLSIVGRVGIGYFSDRFGKSKALTSSFILCGLGHLAFWLPGVALGRHEGDAATALFTLFVVYIGIFGSGFISLFPVVVADTFGAENLASKTGLLNTAVGITTLAGPTTVYAIIGNGEQRRWILGVLTAGLFMILGGLILSTLSKPWRRSERCRQLGTEDIVVSP